MKKKTHTYTHNTHTRKNNIHVHQFFTSSMMVTLYCWVGKKNKKHLYVFLLNMNFINTVLSSGLISSSLFGRVFKNPSFKKALSRWAGVVQGLPFFKVLYLVGMKRRTSKHVTCKKKQLFTFFIIYVSSLTFEIYLLVNLFFQSYILPLFFSVLLSYLVGMKSGLIGVSHTRETSLISFVMYLSPLKPKSCAGRNSPTV